MNRQEEIFFEAVAKDRSKNADTLDKLSLRGIKKSIIEKYSDQAHFIYELLQNADDAKATTAFFLLKRDKLIFIHNGKKHFSISDPENEEFDANNGCLGDINALTSIANSNKDEASIGKFGIGFKSVFQYTSTPHIYDPNFCFRIERFVIPRILESDFPGRKTPETVFVFPFDNPETSAAAAYEVISEKLKSLSFPLLFLRNLEKIEYKYDGISGEYTKNIQQSSVHENIFAEQVCLTQKAEDGLRQDFLWVFSRQNERQSRYSVGFFLDSAGKLKPVHEPAFCFFPTKEETGLGFVVHAPFLLTENRESIRADLIENSRMIDCLAELAAASLVLLRDMSKSENVYLIDDSFITFIPIEPEKFSKPSDKRKISFLPFYRRIKEIFKKENLLPSAKSYAFPQDAYWAAVPELAQLFSNRQLADITGNPNAQWILMSLGREEIQRNNPPLAKYVDELGVKSIDEETILGMRGKNFIGHGITATFIEAQSFAWLHTFYWWLSESEARKKFSVNRPFFLDQNRRAVAARDSQNRPVLFLPVEGIEEYTVIHSELLKQQRTREFFDEIGIQPPSLKEHIYNTVLPQYIKGEKIDTTLHFKIFFTYYCSCPNEDVDNFIKILRSCKFLTYVKEGATYRGRADSMYLPSKELSDYFETKKSVRFIKIEKYKRIVGIANINKLMNFLAKLGVKKDISIIDQEIDSATIKERGLPNPYSTKTCTWKESVIDGCKELVEYICTNKDTGKSVVLWNSLLRIIAAHCNHWNTLENILQGKVSYFHCSWHSQSFLSSDAINLRTKPWVKDNKGNFVSPSKLDIHTLSGIYNTGSDHAAQLLRFLGIKLKTPQGEIVGDSGSLTDLQRQKLALAERLEAYGIVDEADLEEFQEFRRQKRAEKTVDHAAVVPSPAGNSSVILSTGDENADSGASLQPVMKNVEDSVLDAIIQDIVQRIKQNSYASSSVDYEDIDNDDFTPFAVDYGKKIECAKDDSALEISKIVDSETLYSRALRLTREAKYSFAWFTTLLELEALSSAESHSMRREFPVNFAHVAHEADTNGVLVLSCPDRHIPHFVEELAEISLVLRMGNRVKTVNVDVVGIRAFSLRVKVKSEDIDGIDLDSLTEATINAADPTFLLEELRRHFADLNYEDTFNMKDNICKNIEFILGPPGTGKTTYLAQKVLIPLMKNQPKCKVLVLTPTNKSADVLVKRIMEVSGNDASCADWLVRFGSTGDEVIEQSPVFKERTFNIRALEKSVTVTTISRFAYDCFLPEGRKISLHTINWDYIVIDEASMVPLASIMYPLYKKSPRKFIIAGDPFQIEPHLYVDIWKNENIFTMIELHSFSNPVTRPHEFKVTPLTVQFRSIPAIGKIYSDLTYGGVLQHYRSIESQRNLSLEDYGIRTLNIIKYPVSTQKNIYCAKRLQHKSSYHVYSALFTFEYVCFLSRNIVARTPGIQLKIGIVTPYRAQAVMLEKLLSHAALPSGMSIRAGTIHAFQGDECDIMFALFNTPPNIASSKELFVNNQNIINVSISRAKDYLFIVMPDDNTEGIFQLQLIKKIESLIHETNVWQEFFSHTLEKLIFGNDHYLEDNTLLMPRQSINVCDFPESHYEVRSDDSFIEIKIHNTAS